MASYSLTALLMILYVSGIFQLLGHELIFYDHVSCNLAWNHSNIQAWSKYLMQQLFTTL